MFIKNNSKEKNFFNTVNTNVINRKMQIKFFLILFCFVLNNMKFDFLKLIESLLAWNQLDSFSNSELLDFCRAL